MKTLLAAAAMALIMSPASAQTTKPMPQYGDINGSESPAEIETKKRDDAAYKRSLSNIPNAKPTDPWGDVRTENAGKPAAKATLAKPAKPTASVK